VAVVVVVIIVVATAAAAAVVLVATAQGFSLCTMNFYMMDKDTYEFLIIISSNV